MLQPAGQKGSSKSEGRLPEGFPRPSRTPRGVRSIFRMRSRWPGEAAAHRHSVTAVTDAAALRAASVASASRIHRGSAPPSPTVPCAVQAARWCTLTLLSADVRLTGETFLSYERNSDRWLGTPSSHISRNLKGAKQRDIKSFSGCASIYQPPTGTVCTDHAG